MDRKTALMAVFLIFPIINFDINLEVSLYFPNRDDVIQAPI